MKKVTLTALALAMATPVAGQSFVNWESPHVNPIDMTPDGTRVLAVNTADNRLEIFNITKDGLARAGAIPVGLDPVSVRAFSDSVAWVVNHISDSVSIVDLDQLNTLFTISTGDEPTDVIFAGTPRRAFVTVSQLNQVKVYDPDDPGAEPIVIDIEGEDPRAMTTDGVNVYVAIFNSGNLTTALNEDMVVSEPEFNPYLGDPNPPPNDGGNFSPPINPKLPTPPPVGLVVKKSPDGRWQDDNGGDWSTAVTWDLHDHDIAIIDADNIGDVGYVTGVMNLNMHLDYGPNGIVVVVGTTATNEIRFEPNLTGTFVRVMIAGLRAENETPFALFDLNPHLTYDEGTIPQDQRNLSIGDPRAVKWNSTGSRLYIASMGTSQLDIRDGGANRLALTDVGEGPTGIAVDDARNRVYVLSKFEGSISVVSTVTGDETRRIRFHDPTPFVIKTGRPHLYNTHRTSGLGQSSCGSCHIDGRMDHLGWDLGNPAGEMKKFNQDCINDPDICTDWHPMKGITTTQTLVGALGTEPLHWRGDKEDLAAFNPAFVGLLGDDVELTDTEMAEFEAFVTTMVYPPNPFRNMDNSLSDSHPNGGNPQIGEVLFGAAPGRQSPILGDHSGGEAGEGMQGGFNCNACHAVPTGTDSRILASIDRGGVNQSFKTAQLRASYDKLGFVKDVGPVNKGFGILHDGGFGGFDEFFRFFFGMTADERLDLEAFVLSIATDSHAGIGVQVTLGDVEGPTPEEAALLDAMATLAVDGAVGFVAKGRVDGIPRGFMFQGSTSGFQSDRRSEGVSLAALVDGAAPGSEVTFTLVPFGSQERIGIDRDQDGFFDQDEIDHGTDPADPDSVPSCPGDVDGDNTVDFFDLVRVLADWGACDDPNNCPADMNEDGEVGFPDLLLVLGNWGPCF